ncbi:hypothetical protein [Roseococcus sp.]|uniref:hypothetical protein n=1 Tax=Roseococcus sp. TaxID=2109646 RepID=UPI003BAB7CA5
MGAQALGHSLRRHHHPGRAAGDHVELGQVLTGRGGAGVFRMGQRNEVVHQGHEARPERDHAAGGALVVQGAMRHDQEEAVLARRDPAGELAAAHAPEFEGHRRGRHRAEAREHPLLARKDGAVGLSQEGMGEAVRQGGEPAPGRLRDEGDILGGKAAPMAGMREFDSIDAAGLAGPGQAEKAGDVEHNMHAVTLLGSWPDGGRSSR